MHSERGLLRATRHDAVAFLVDAYLTSDCFLFNATVEICSRDTSLVTKTGDRYVR
jgi:hypothetical protein